MISENEQLLSERKINFIIAVVMLLGTLIGMAVDLISPALPAMANTIHVSPHFVKNLITIYILGYALGNFVLGFLSDAWGRRKIFLCGLLVFTIISLLPAATSNVWLLLVMRFVQGFSLSAAAVLGRAVFADILPSERLSRIGPLMSASWGIGPIIGPVIGGYLQYYFGWQACFYFFAAFGFLGFISLVVILPETHKNPQPLNLQQIKKNIIEVVSHRFFMGVVLIMGTTYSMLIAFNTLAPFLIQRELGFSSIDFGHMAFFLGICFLLGSVYCRALLKKLQPESVLSFYLPIIYIFVIVALVISYMASKNIWIIFIPSMIVFFGVGIFYPVGGGKTLLIFRHLAGTASAVVSLLPMLFTSICSMLISFIVATSAVPIMWIYIILLTICFASYWFLIRPKEAN